MLFKDVYKLSFTPCVFSMLFLDNLCRMFVFLLVIHCVLSSGIIKETMNEKKRSERRKHCARAGCSKVRTPPRYKHTDRTDNNTLRRS